MTTDHIHNQISQRSLDFFLMDLKELRGKYRIISEDIPHKVVMTAERDMIIDRLLVEEFGTKTVEVYRDQVSEWEEARAVFEGKIVDDDLRFLPNKKPTVEEILFADLPHLKTIETQRKLLTRKFGC